MGFPLGSNLSEVKRFEAEKSIEHGADEIDMVINLGAVKNNDWITVEKDIAKVTLGLMKQGHVVPVKVILETGLLTNNEIIQACKVSENAGAKFVKTCTGFSVGAAMVEHIKLMKDSISAKMEVKASGGIKSFSQAIALIEAGATRLGTSSGVQLIKGNSDTSIGY